MKICIFTHTFPRFPGDTAAPFMGVLAEGLSKTGNKVIVLTPYDQRFKTRKDLPYKVKTYRYIYPDALHKLGYSRTLRDDKKMSPFSYFLSVFLYLFGFVALLKLVHEEEIDIISSHWIIPNGFMAALASKVTGVPFTTTIPGSDVYMGGKNELFRLMVGFAAKNADYVLSDSSHYLKQLNDLGFFPEKCQIIRYGVRTAKFKPTAKNRSILKKLEIKQKSPIILAVGRMVAKKGFVYLIEAMPDILKRYPEAKLLMVGEGEEKERLEKKVKILGIGKCMVFTGTIPYDKLSIYYNLADVFVMPSIRDEKGNIDASPVAMMEAMACGTPVVATGFAGSKDLIVKGKTGYLVEERNSQQIADFVINLLADMRRNRSDTRGLTRKIAIDNFSVESTAQKYINVFQEIKI